MEKEIKQLLDELFELIGIKVQVEIKEERDSSADAQNDGKVYKVEIGETESAGLLIGAHGTTLAAIQSFLTIAMKQKTGDWVKISVDIAKWTEKQNARLVELAKSAAERARQTKEDQKLYNLNATQRRIIHMTLSTEEGIETLSEGEGEDRVLIVRAK